MFPDVTRKTKPLDKLKPYINAELRKLIKDKYLPEQNIKRHHITYEDRYKKFTKNSNEING